jgi:hypothetical protein
MTDTPSNPAADDLALLLVQLGAEVATPLAQALERLHEHMAQGDEAVNAALVSLREPLRRARDATLQAAQIGRLSSGRVIPSQEPCALHSALHQVVEMRRREANSRGLQIRLDAGEAEANTDPALLPSLFHALLDWALWHTRSSIELQLSLSAWPPQARLQCRFALRDLDQAPGQHKSPNLNGLRWMLVGHTARALGVQLRREDEAGVCVTRLEFPLLRREIDLDLPEVSTDTGRDTQPFAGWLAMVVSANPEFQRRVGEIMQPLGWALDRVHSVDEAFQHCLDALPQAIVVDGALAGPDLRQWRYHVLADAPGFCFIEVGERPPLGNRRADDGLHCAAGALENELPGLLREALTPPGEALTFRI